jgi:hypothetical protein
MAEMAHPHFCTFSAKSNAFSVSTVSKGEKTAKIRPYIHIAPTNTKTNKSAVIESGIRVVYFKKNTKKTRGGHWSKKRAAC